MIRKGEDVETKNSFCARKLVTISTINQPHAESPNSQFPEGYI